MKKCLGIGAGRQHSYEELRPPVGEETRAAVQRVRDKAATSTVGKWDVPLYSGKHPYQFSRDTTSKDWTKGRQLALLLQGVHRARARLGDSHNAKSGVKALLEYFGLAVELADEQDEMNIEEILGLYGTRLSKIATSHQPRVSKKELMGLLDEIEGTLRQRAMQAGLRRVGFG